MSVSPVLIVALAIFAYMSLLFVWALVKKDNSLADIGWGPGFVFVALLTLFWTGTFEARQVLLSGLVLVWGSRLGIHIGLRKRGKPEDFRYAAWRKAWGRTFVVRSFFQIFMLQGLFMFLISWPVWLVNLSPSPGLNVLDAAGAAIWLGGFLFETVGDVQMERFKRRTENKGRIMTGGLWSLTRHPNYFGEAAMWWGLFLIALSAPSGLRSVVSPILITFLLVKVSGIPLLERKYAGRPDWEEYARRTSAFIPWFPKK